MRTSECGKNRWYSVCSVVVRERYVSGKESRLHVEYLVVGYFNVAGRSRGVACASVGENDSKG